MSGTASGMDVDSMSKKASEKQNRSRRIEKRGRRKSSIVFPKFTTKRGQAKKK
jgi:hypothetical protein